MKKINNILTFHFENYVYNFFFRVSTRELYKSRTNMHPEMSYRDKDRKHWNKWQSLMC